MPTPLTICADEAFICAEQMRVPPCHIYLRPRDSALSQPGIRPCRLHQGKVAHVYGIWCPELWAAVVVSVDQSLSLSIRGQPIDIPCKCHGPIGCGENRRFACLSVVHLSFPFRSHAFFFLGQL
jgi:hypothetical protein